VCLRTRDRNSTFPLLSMRALKCDVLFPGAEVASITTLSSEAGGARTKAGKHDALSCSMIFPEMYRGSFWKVVLGLSKSRLGTCSS
jgi:hypothetical protein